MSEQAHDKILSGINIPKTIAGALAAVCAAVIGSFLGVAGTLIGAAVASIIGSVGTEIYERSLHRGAKKLQTIAPAFIKAPAAVGTPAVAAATEEDSPSHTVPEGARRQIRWGHVALVAGALFVLAMGTVAIIELYAGRSLATIVGNPTKARSTFSGFVNPGSSKPTPTTAPSATPTDTTPANQAPATQPNTQPTTEAPNTTTTTAPGTATTTAPPLDAPQQTAPPAAPQNQIQRSP
jgi:hypothetical protein